MGVLRGKLSEGLDFPDELSRAVFVIGIPFAPINNLKVKTKKEV
jgi:regulator of telomere elongation helicase 1